MDTQVWYVLEYSYRDADEWFESSKTADTEERLREIAKKWMSPIMFDYRIARKTLTTETLDRL